MASDWNRSTTQEHLRSVDLHVGERIRMRRMFLGVDPGDLAHALDVTLQQFQRYEQGASRISVGKLYRLCFLLEVPMSFFFEDLEGGHPENRRDGSPAPAPTIPADPAQKREMLEFIRAFNQIPRPALRRLIVDLVKEMAEDAEEARGEGH